MRPSTQPQHYTHFFSLHNHSISPVSPFPCHHLPPSVTLLVMKTRTHITLLEGSRRLQVVSRKHPSFPLIPRHSRPHSALQPMPSMILHITIILQNSPSFSETNSTRKSADFTPAATCKSHLIVLRTILSHAWQSWNMSVVFRLFWICLLTNMISPALTKTHYPATPSSPYNIPQPCT